VSNIHRENIIKQTLLKKKIQKRRNLRELVRGWGRKSI